jgi:hypothetical protein
MSEYVYDNKLWPDDLIADRDPDPYISDPPYVYGDHAATCRGCPPCDQAEDEYLARITTRLCNHSGPPCNACKDA